MPRYVVLILLSIIINVRADSFLINGANIDIEFVTIGNAGNVADLNSVYNWSNYTSDPRVETFTGVGRVDYVYRIAKYENGFLGQKSGSWYDAGRFVNDLNVSKGFQAAYKFDSNDQFVLWGTGEYTGSNQYRNKDAVYFLPSIDEFYKAAYYDPQKNNGAGGYWKYATASDTTPLPTSGGTDPYTAVWQSIDRVDVKNAGGLSAYGTMAQNGNYSEWIETAFDGTNDNPSEIRNLISGNWSNVHDGMGKDNRDVHNPAVWDSMYINFRVASVPEPSALSLLAIGLGGLTMIRRRRS